MGLQLALQDPDSNSCGYIPRSRIVGSYYSSIFSLLRNIHTLSMVAAANYIYINIVPGFQFLHIVANTCYFIFVNICSNWYEVISPCGFDIYFLHDYDVEHSFMYLLVIPYVLFREMSIQFLWPHFCFCCYCLVGVPYVFWHISDIWFINIFPIQ